MRRDYFITLENHSNKEALNLECVIEQLAFNEQGLIPVITQDAKTQSVLMFAWMNITALKQTIATKKMTYWSRSRQQLWLKGETSGHSQEVVSMAFDCDGDVILCKVKQLGAACHTGRKSCFYLDVDIKKELVWVKGDYT